MVPILSIASPGPQAGIESEDRIEMHPYRVRLKLITVIPPTLDGVIEDPFDAMISLHHEATEALGMPCR